VIEIAGRGPGPFAGMMLADMGADVIRVDRPGAPTHSRMDPKLELVNRGRRFVMVDLSHSSGREIILRMVDNAHVLFEGFRPGVVERLGIGPDDCLARNPRLVFGRVTGWGQHGPLAHAPGHDINYIALAGVLGAIGRKGGPPAPPLNLLGDNAGGGMLLAFGLLCALLESRVSGQGQVVDASMLDGASLLMTLIHGRQLMGLWSDERGSNLLDSGYPLYDAYKTRDGKYLTVGAIEPKFRDELVSKLGINTADLRGSSRDVSWPELRHRLETAFASKTRDEWDELLLGTETCYAPVLTLSEARQHPHSVARSSFVEIDGVPQPAPAPRFSRSVSETPRPPAPPGANTEEVLRQLGFDEDELAQLREDGIIN